MNDEERRVITAFVERIAGAQQGQAWGGGGAPQARPALPPVDPDADRMLWELFNRHPEARYRITQTAFVQEAALVEATNRIRQLEWEVENARRQGQAMAAQAPRGGLFGGGRPAVAAPAPMPPPPQPQYPPGYNAQALQQAPGRTGSGFLGTAVATAAGVAGGVVLGSVLMNAFSGGGAAHAGGFGGGGFGGSSGGGAFGQQPVGSSWGSDGGQKADGGSPWGGDNAGSSGSSWGQDAGGASPGAWTPDVQPDSGGYSQDSGGYDGGGGGGSDDN